MAQLVISVHGARRSGSPAMTEHGHPPRSPLSSRSRRAAETWAFFWIFGDFLTGRRVALSAERDLLLSRLPCTGELIAGRDGSGSALHTLGGGHGSGRRPGALGGAD